VLVAGFDGTDVRDLTVVPAGSAVSATAPTTIVGGTDGTDARALTLVAPGAAAPADILCVMPGFDGTDERQLTTDTSGRLVLPPSTNSVLLSQTLTSSGAGGSTAFGPTGAINAKWWNIAVDVGAATVTGAGFLFVELSTTTTGIVITQAQIWLPLTIGFTALAAAGQSLSRYLSGTFGEGGLSVPAAATDDFTLAWSYGATLSAITAHVDVVVGY